MKQLIAIALVAIMSAFLFIGSFAVNCDVSGDGTCDIVDVLVVIKSLLNGKTTETMDVTGDGQVNLLDVLKVLKTAAGIDTEEITEPTFIVGDVTASAGDTAVSVPVSVVKNPGILGMTLVVSYDDTVMTLTGSANGAALDMLSFTKPKNHKNGCIFTWYGEALEDADIVDGEILTLTFDIIEDAPNGSYPVGISYVEGDIFDANLTPVEIAIQNGSCNIVGETEGDGNDNTGDGGNTGDTEEITEPTFVVSEVTASAGDTAVSVPISIVKNPGILGMTLVVNYDDTVMTLTNSTNGDALDMLSFTKPKKYKSGSIFTWYGEALEDTDIVDGDVLTLTFDVSATATAGTYPIEISYVEGDIFDANLTPVEIAIQNGNLIVTQ